MSFVELKPETLVRDALSIAQAVLKHLSEDTDGLYAAEWPSDLMDLVKRARSHPMVHGMSPAEYCSVLRVLWHFWDLGGGTDEDVDVGTDGEDEDEDEDENKENSVTMQDRYRFWFEDAEPHGDQKRVILPACDLADGMNTFAPLPEGYGLAVFLKDFHKQGCPGLVPIAAIVLMLELMRITADVFMEQGDLVDLLLQLAGELIEHIKSYGTLFGGDSGGPAPVARAVAAVAAAAAADDSSGKPQDPRQLAVKARAMAKRKADSSSDAEPPAVKPRLQEYIVGFNKPHGTVKLRTQLPGGGYLYREVEVPSDMVGELFEGDLWSENVELLAAKTRPTEPSCNDDNNGWVLEDAPYRMSSYSI